MEERGSFLARLARGSPPQEIREHRRGQGLGCGKIGLSFMGYERARGEKLSPHPRGKGHLCGPAAGWVGPRLCVARRGSNKPFCRDAAWLGGLPLGAGTQGNAGCLRTSWGCQVVLDCGAAKRGSKTANLSPAPFPLQVSALRREGVAGRSCPKRALSAAFSLLRFPHRVPGQGCVQPPRTASPFLLVHPRGHRAPEPWGLEAQDQLGMEAVDPKSPSVCVSTVTG